AGLEPFGTGFDLEDLEGSEQLSLRLGKAGEPRVGGAEEAPRGSEPPVAGGIVAFLDLERVKEERLRGSRATLVELDAREADLLAGDGRVILAEGRPGDRQGFLVSCRRAPARLARRCAFAGCSLPRLARPMASACRNIASAAAWSPRSLTVRARLERAVATSGCTGPRDARVTSRVCRNNVSAPVWSPFCRSR